MKKLTFIAVLAITALFFASCGKKDYEKFIGTWGVEKIEYYNIDYAGDLIPGSMTTYDYDPNSTDNGINWFSGPTRLERCVTVPSTPCTWRMKKRAFMISPSTAQIRLSLSRLPIPTTRAKVSFT